MPPQPVANIMGSVHSRTHAIAKGGSHAELATRRRYRPTPRRGLSNANAQTEPKRLLRRQSQAIGGAEAGCQVKGLRVKSKGTIEIRD